MRQVRQDAVGLACVTSVLTNNDLGNAALGAWVGAHAVAVLASYTSLFSLQLCKHMLASSVAAKK